MKRTSLILAFLLFVPAAAFAQYIVVLKDGKRYEATARYQIVDGKAIVRLTTGSVLQIDPSLIDGPASERMTRSGLGSAQVIGVEESTPSTPSGAQEPSLGSRTRLRNLENETPGDAAAASRSTGPIATSVLNRYRDAYENIGFYDASIKPSGADRLVVEIIADNEQQVFNALSATAVLISKVPAAANTPMSQVDLRLMTARGESAGTFRMTHSDAKALESRSITPQQWFVRNVIF